MTPAFHIFLTAAEKRLVADIAAIQSQVEWLMRLTVQHLLSVSPETAQNIMGSTNIGSTSSVWRDVIRDKCEDDAVKQWAEFAFAQMSDMAKGRNDYLHTLYGLDTDQAPHGRVSFMFSHEVSRKNMKEPRRAIRVKTSADAPIADLKAVRDRAAYLSRVLAHIERSVSPHCRDMPSPWPRRLGSKLPPESPKAKPTKGKGHPPRPQS